MKIGSSLLLIALLASPAFAANGWDIYFNQRYGYATAVPPGFAGEGEPDDHDGQVFKGPGGATLTVWGGYIGAGWDNEVGQRLDDLKANGWTITYQSITPSWASVSGTRGQAVIYMREISGCSGANYATFQLQYRSTEINAMNPVVERLVKGLKQMDCQ
jgi:hypothetical protein